MSSLSNFGSESLKPSELLGPRTFSQDPHSLQRMNIRCLTSGRAGSFSRHESCMKSAIACNIQRMLNAIISGLLRVNRRIAKTHIRCSCKREIISI